MTDLITENVRALRPLATLALGLTGADVERIVREARQVARRQRRVVTWQDIEAGLRGTRPPLTADALWRVCIHEAGHAVAWTLLGVGEVVSVITGGAELGQVASRRYHDIPETEDWLTRTLGCLLAGRAAEILVFKEAVAGAGGADESDLAKATELALAAETRLGFSEKHPLVYRNASGGLGMLNLDRELAERVNQRLLAADDMVRVLLEGRRTELTEIARRLKSRGVMEGTEVRQVLGVAEKAARSATGGLDEAAPRTPIPDR